MKIILIKDLPGKGKKNQIIDVSDGYAQNFVIKQGFGVVYTPESLKKLEKQIENNKKEHDSKRAIANERKKQLEQLELCFELKVNKDQVFGSISKKEIINKLKTMNIEYIDKTMIEEHLKLSLGSYKIKINLFDSITALLSIIIKPSVS
jgi:large subunit ribosomal protein L9